MRPGREIGRPTDQSVGGWVNRASAPPVTRVGGIHDGADGLPEDFDWRDHAGPGQELGFPILWPFIYLPIWPPSTLLILQGSCGSCRSLSPGVGGANHPASCKMEVLSSKEMSIDHECDTSEPDSCDVVCNGGLMASAFSYLLKSGGLEREKDYPYTGKDGTCKFDKSKIDASVQNYSVVTVDEEQIAANLVKYGPLAIGINAAYMQTYIGGVSCPYICGRHLDHGVLLIGYGASGFAPSRFKEKPYWIVKNSWGENWGDQGYYKICRGSNVRNKCGVDSMVSTVSATHSSKEEQALV
ncbi:hypothetical protein ZWY2020_003521 [Hordeum vulgare]|nr:hypothetical protein ZWY2020_003521 [Hordeum vulgare]